MTERPELSLRVATYNVHGCIGTDGKRAEARIAKVIAEMNVDVIGLQELDRNRRRSGDVDQAQIIAQELGWQAHFHATVRKDGEDYGHAILSRYPFAVRRAHELPGSAPFYCRQTRVALAVDLTTNLGRVHVVSTHLGLGWRERLKQATRLTTDDCMPSNIPLVLLGDFNSVPGSRPYRAVTRRLRDVRRMVAPARAVGTFPTRFPLLAVDHIFVNEAFVARSLKVHRTALARVASDHFPLVSELELC